MENISKKSYDSEKVLKIIAYILTSWFCLLAVFPLIFMFMSSLQDSEQIYKFPPDILPNMPKAITVTIDYSDLQSDNQDKLEDEILKDAITAHYTIPYEFNKEGIAETTVIGQYNGKTIYKSTSNKMLQQMEVDFGVYKGSRVSRKVLVYGDKYVKASKSNGYVFNLGGVSVNTGSNKSNDKADFDKISTMLTEKNPVTGKIISVDSERKFFLLFKKFYYYFKLPTYLYKKDAVIAKFSFLVFLKNTVMVICWAIVTQIFLCSMPAFALSKLIRKKYADRIILFFLGTMMIPFIVTMIPQILMFRSLGFYNNYAAMLVPYLAPYGFFVYLFKGFFDRLPQSLFDAAKIDGATELFSYFKLCLPLSKPILALVAMQVFLSNWNDFMWFWLVTEKPSLMTLNVVLYNLSRSSFVKQNFLLGISFTSMIPVLLLTIGFSEQIKQSIASSGIKG